MKTMHLFALCSMAFASALYAEDAVINGGTQAEPASFGDSSYTKDTAVILNGAEGGASYFKVAEDITVGSIKTQKDITSDYYLDAEGKTITIDAADKTTGQGTDIILFSNNNNTTSAAEINGTFSIGKGTYNVVSTAATNQADVISRIGVATNNTTGTHAKNITIESGAVINAHTKLSLSGTVGGYGAINIAGEVNTFANDEKGTGNLIMDWTSNPYGTGGGTRTQVNVLDGGSISTGNVLMKVNARLDVMEGGTLNISDSLTWATSDSNSGGRLISYGTTNIENVTMTATNANGSATGALQVFVRGGTTTVATLTQSENSKSSVNVEGGTLNVTDTYVMDTGSLYVKGGTANVSNLMQTGGKIDVTGGTLNFNGSNNVVSNDTISSSTGSIINFKAGSDNTFGTMNGTTAITYSNLKGNVNFEKGSTLRVDNTLTITNGTWNFDGSLISTKAANNGQQSLKFEGVNTKFTFGENATLTANSSRIWVGNSTVVFNSATNSVKTNSFVLSGSAKLEFNKENSVVATNGTSYSITLNLTSGSTPTITLKDTQKFGKILFQGLISDENKGDTETKNNLAKLTLNLDFANKTDYVSFEYAYTNGTHGDKSLQDYVNIYVSGFEDNRIFITDKDNKDSAKASIVLLDADNKNAIINFQYVAATVDGVSGFWLNTPIPEPAEWAAIFGAIALGFAIYRRRKA